jgi:hypothetical protein
MTLRHERLCEVLKYNPETGAFVWRVKTSSRALVGYTAGVVCKSRDYVLIGLDKRHYLAHRLAWFYVFGVWPMHEIDHINGNKKDNRLSNLRQATRTENCRNVPIPSNNSSGTRGVCFYKQTSRWRARINVEKREIGLGYFLTKDDAIEARRKAELHYFGQFRRAE